MKDYIQMYPLHVAPDWKPYGKGVERDSIIHLVSETIEAEADAQKFAIAIANHCHGKTRAVGDIVYGDFYIYSISANWRDKDRYFEFASWD